MAMMTWMPTKQMRAREAAEMTIGTRIPPQAVIDELHEIAAEYGLELVLEWGGVAGIGIAMHVATELLQCIQNDKTKDALRKEGQLILVEYVIGLALPGS